VSAELYIMQHVLIMDRLSREATAIASVRPSVCPLSTGREMYETTDTALAISSL